MHKASVDGRCKGKSLFKSNSKVFHVEKPRKKSQKQPMEDMSQEKGDMLSGKPQSLHSENVIDFPVNKEPVCAKRCTGLKCYPRTDLVSTGLCLIYWHDVSLSLAVFLCVFLLQLTMALYPTLTVAAYLALSIITINFTYCCCYGFAGILRNTNQPHPFSKYLKQSINMSQDDMHDLIESTVMSVSSVLMTFKELIFVKDVKSSLKFYILLWLLVPIGIWFSNMCLALICTVGFFTLPKLYDKYKVQVDEFTISAERRLSLAYNRLQEKIAIYRERQ